LSNTLEFDRKTWHNKIMQIYSWKQIDAGFIRTIKESNSLEYIQISKNLPDEALEKINSIFIECPWLKFRIYGMFGEKSFDIAGLSEVSAVDKLRIEAVKNSNFENFKNLDLLSNVKKELSRFELTLCGNFNIQFIDDIAIKSLYLLVEGGKIEFKNNFWNELKVEELELGKKAVNYVNLLRENKTLKKLTVFQAVVKDLSPYENLNLESLRFVNTKLKSNLSISAVSEFIDSSKIKEIYVNERRIK